MFPITPCPKVARAVNPDLIAWVRNKRDKCCMWGASHKDNCSAGLDVHHIQTKGSGGGDVQENLITLCRKHHDMAGARRIRPEELHAVLSMYYAYEYEDE